MCLAIPGQIVELDGSVEDLATVEVAGVRRRISVGLIDDARPGDWVLIHVGFAMSRIDEAEAEATLEFLSELGMPFEEELAELKASRIE